MSTTQTIQDTPTLLSQLRDIQVPAPSGGWVPSLNAWWLSLALILVSLMTVLIVYRYYKRTRTRRYALHELLQMQERFAEHGQRQRLLNELNVLLRRMAMINYDREKISPLAGRNWLEFLDRSGNTKHFSQGVGQVLIQAYEPAPEPFDADALNEVVTQWIRQQL